MCLEDNWGSHAGLLLKFRQSLPSPGLSLNMPTERKSYQTSFESDRISQPGCPEHGLGIAHGPVLMTDGLWGMKYLYQWSFPSPSPLSLPAHWGYVCEVSLQLCPEQCLHCHSLEWYLLHSSAAHQLPVPNNLTSTTLVYNFIKLMGVWSEILA